jgi:hypothetical protein
MIKRGDFFICERRCGFTETFEVVQEHEKTCKFVPEGANGLFNNKQGQGQGQGSRSQFNEEFAYVCVHGCGYTGTYEAVEEHEYVCAYAKRPEEEAMYADRPRNPAETARLAKEIMSMQQGGDFNLADVAGFWSMAGEDWRSGANMFHMSRMAGGDILPESGFGGKGDKKGGSIVDGKGKGKAKGKGKGKAK